MAARERIRLILVKLSGPEIVESVSSHQWRLSAKGRADTATLASHIATYAPQVVVTSTEPKAMETGIILARQLDLPCEPMPGLQENDRIGLPYLSDDDYAATFRHFFEQPDELVVGRETARQAGDRFAAAIDCVMAEHSRVTIAVVSHGTVISLWLQRAAGIDPFPLWQRLGTPSYVVLSLPDLMLERIVEQVS